MKRKIKTINLSDIQELDEVEILATGERAIVVDVPVIPGQDSYMLEIIGKNEMPLFYTRKEFKFIKR
mgnify:CR=1 FL=1